MRVALGIVLIAATATLAPALWPGAGLAWDDVPLIRDNPLVTAPDGLTRVFTGTFWQMVPDVKNDYYRPIVSLSYWLEHMLFGGEPLAFHWVNLLLHVACTVLVYRWLLRRVDCSGLPERTVAAWLALSLVLFALHPSRPECVAWISGRTDPMALLFALLAMEAWQREGRARLFATPVLFVLAVLSKETAVMVVGLWFLDGWLLADAHVGNRKLERSAWAVLALTVGALALRIAIVPPLVRHPGTPAGSFAALGMYLRELVAPFPPSAVIAPPIRDAQGDKVFEASWVALGAVATVALVALAVLALRRRGLRPWLADVAWFVAPLLPVLRIVEMPFIGHVALRFLYIPMLGVCALVLRAGLGWARRGQSTARLPLGLAVGAALIYAPFTFAYASAYRSNEALWQYELAVDPNRAYVITHALDQLPQGDLAAARALSREGIRAAERERDFNSATIIAEKFARLYAGSIPLDECPEDVIHALDALALARPAHFGKEDPLVVTLPEEAARKMRDRYGKYWSLRAELMVRCGALRQALENLEHAPKTLDTAILRARAQALRGDTGAALATLRETAQRYPLEPVVGRTEHAVRVATQMVERAEAEPALAPIFVARLHMALGDLHGARVLLSEAEAALADQVAYHHALVDLEVLVGREGGAAQALERARAAHPEAEPLWRRLEERGLPAPSR